MKVKIGDHSSQQPLLLDAFNWWLGAEGGYSLYSLALELSRSEHQDIQYLKEDYGFHFYVDDEDCLALKKIAAKAGLGYSVHD
jgi:hypothetical protein